MRLQKKVFRVIVGTLLGLSLVMSFTTNHRTVKAFESIERRFFEQDMFLLQKYIDEEVNRLTDYVSDWGAWDAMYSFMETKDTLRFEELLTGTSLRAIYLPISFLSKKRSKPADIYISLNSSALSLFFIISFIASSPMLAACKSRSIL